MTYTAEKIRKMEPALIAKASPVHIENVIKDLIAYALAAPAVANGVAGLPPLPSDRLATTYTGEEMRAYARAAIAAFAQQTAPKPLTKAQSHALATCVNGGTQMGWISDDDARAILTAAAPNALLVAALKDCADIMLSNGLDECEAYESARAALESVPTASEATE